MALDPKQYQADIILQAQAATVREPAAPLVVVVVILPPPVFLDEVHIRDIILATSP